MRIIMQSVKIFLVTLIGTFTYFSILAFAEVNKSSVILEPKLEFYNSGSVVSCSDGNIYVCGILNGVEGLYRVTPDGAVSLFIAGLWSNDVTTDKSGNNIFVYTKQDNKLYKVSIASAAVVSTTVLSPKPSILTTTFCPGRDGNLYMAGTLNGNDGVLKLSEDGTVSVLYAGLINNSMTSDYTGEHIYVYNPAVNRMTKISIATGGIEYEMELSTKPYFLLQRLVSSSDGNLYFSGGLVQGEYKLLEITPDGNIKVFEDNIPDDIVADSTGEHFYSVDIQAKTTSSVKSAAIKKSNIDTSGKDIILTRYNVIIDKISVPQNSVEILGGAQGYVNPSKGEVATVVFKANKTGNVTIKIFTLSGQPLWEASKETDGTKDFIEWACKNSGGGIVSSDVYIVKVDGPGISETKKVVILR